MTSGRPGSNRFRFDIAEPPVSVGPGYPATRPKRKAVPRDERLETAVERTRDWLLEQQHDEGYWVGELEGDTILESEYLLLLTYLGQERSETARLAANYILEKQLPDGGWAIYPGGPLEVSASVKAYFVLKLTGHSPQAESMVRAREAIRAAGGAERVNSFTRFYLALLGVLRYDQCPAVPPELMLIPRWVPFNIYEMSAWSRTILIPLSVMWAHRPVRPLPPEMRIDELFLGRPENLPACMPPAKTLDELKSRTWLDWTKVFRRIDGGLKLLDRLRIRPLRKLALRRAAAWMLERFENSDGLGAIFPPIIWSVVALKCLGYSDDSPEVRSQLGELEKLWIREGETLRLQPCKSPVWDTAIATLALREAEVPAGDPAIRGAVRWLLSKEVRRKGDWAVRSPGQEAGGWFFEFHNEFYPDIDDTSMVVLALSRSLPQPRRGAGFQSPLMDDDLDFGDGQVQNLPHGWDAEFLPNNWSPHEADRDAAAVLSAHDVLSGTAPREIEALVPQLAAVRRGLNWILAMQNRDGGWGAFDANNDRELFTRVPFADHNAMIDPSCADITARMLEMFADLRVSKEHPAVRRAMDFLWREQQADFSWYGRWGVNYIYGTWQALVGLIAIGIPAGDTRIRRAADWLKATQQSCGGWGETPRSYDDPSLRGEGEPTASQTAWALMGLMAAGEIDSEAVSRGVAFLLDTQNDDGTWDEPWFTGTGFPRVFYLNYHLYRIYFPLMALARYEGLTR